MKSNNPNILVLDNSPSITGAYKSILSATGALKEQFTFYFALSSVQLVNDFSEDGLNVKHVPFLEIQKNWRLLIYFPFLVSNTFRLQKIIKEYQISIVHVNDLYNMCGVILKIFNPSLKVIYHVRLLPTSYAKKLYFIWKRLIEKYADEIICVSETVASNFNKKKATIIFDSITKSNLKKSDENNLTNNIFTILYLANYIPGKGHKQAIQAYRLALPKISNTQLVFYGGTLKKTKNQKFKDYLINYTYELGLSQNILFKGFAKQPEQEIIKADLMLNFSESEAFSMTTLEALVQGTPIIATNCGGPSEIIENGKSGILVAVNDIQAMALSIENLVNDIKLRQLISHNGKIRIKDKFDFENQANLLYKLYNRLL